MIALCEECGQRIDAITRWCTPCNAKHFETNFQDWTSGETEIDDSIRKAQITAKDCECVLEWVDPSKFTLLEKIEFSKNHKAYWEEGHLLRWNVESNEWIRSGGQWVKLVTNYCGEKHLASRLKSWHEFPPKRLIYGLTRDPVTNEYAVIERLMDRCHCGQEWISFRWCRCCSSSYFKSELSKWESGNPDINAFIYEAQITAEFPEQVLEWFPASQFTEFSLIGKGGYGTVYKAFWEKGRIFKWNSDENIWERGEPMWVVLKSVEKAKENVDELLKEVKSLHQCRKINLGSLDCYGISRHPVTQDYLIVMRFVEQGNLRSYLLSNFATSNWKDRLDRLWSLAIDLRSLHRSDLVHRDLHSGNVLIGNNERTFLADLGLSCKDGQHEPGDVKGVLPYMAPEVLSDQPYTKAADIYSYGIVMWEITSFRPPFCEIAYDYTLALNIVDGLRPPINQGTPECFVKLMKQCWDPEPANRPDAQFLVEKLERWIQAFSKGNEDDVDDEKKQFISAELERQENTYPDIQPPELITHPLATLTSCFIRKVSPLSSNQNYQTKQFDLILPISEELPILRKKRESDQ